MDKEDLKHVGILGLYYIALVSLSYILFKHFPMMFLYIITPACFCGGLYCLAKMFVNEYKGLYETTIDALIVGWFLFLFYNNVKLMNDKLVDAGADLTMNFINYGNIIIGVVLGIICAIIVIILREVYLEHQRRRKLLKRLDETTKEYQPIITSRR